MDLSHNRIQDLDFLQDSIKLEHLDLSHNWVRTLVDANMAVGNLRVLLLGSNRVSQPSASAPRASAVSRCPALRAHRQRGCQM